MESLAQDVRYALRQLRRSPGFSTAAVLTLGLGIGAATAIFNAAEVTLHRPLPFEHESRLTRVYRIPEAGTPRISLRPETYMAVERRGRFFDRIVAQRYTSLVHPTPSGPERVVGIGVTAGWAETLGVRPHLGRVFTPEEEALGERSGVVLLSHGAWQRRFGGDAGAIGRELVLDGSARRVVGVMQPGLRYPYDAELWFPIRADGEQVGPWSFNVQARLRPGVTIEDARDELRAIAAEAAAAGEAPTLQADGTTLTAVPFREMLVGEEGRTSLVLLGAVSFLLLIVCANLASLLLARGLGRGRELAVRTSLGASRRRLVWQLLTESLVLSLAGSALGIALAHLGGGLAEPLIPGALGDVDATVTMNGTVLAFAVGLALLTTLLFGLLPALRVSSVRPGTDVLRSGRAAAGGFDGRLADALVVAEIALGVVLLTGAGLVAQDLRRLASADLGYHPDPVLTASVALAGDRYDDAAARVDLVSRALEALSGAPGVAAVGATTMFPSDAGNALARVEVEGREDPGESPPLVNHRLVTPGLLEALGVALVAGRPLSPTDRAGTPPVVLVSTSAARRLWPGEDALGRRVRRPGEDPDWLTVVGVVADVKEFWDVDETWYLPLAQHAGERSASSVTFVLRGEAVPPAGSDVRPAMAAVAPDLPVVDVAVARDLHAASLGRERQGAALGAAFAACGLLLAAMGLYGTVSYGVRRRRREFGIRLALGSDPRRIGWSVLNEGFGRVALGGALGVVGALATGRLLAGVLETVDGADPLTVGAAILALGASTVVAMVLPAGRAARVDPMRVLREE